MNILLRAMLIAIGMAIAIPVYAAASLDWLTTQQNPNGSFGSTPTSLATPIQSTAEVLRAYQTLGQTSQSPYVPALNYLNGDTEVNTEFLARKIQVNVAAGNNVSALITKLLTHQNADGGFGDSPGYESSVLDTAYALQALGAANYGNNQITSSAAAYLLNGQQSGGGWAEGDNDVSVHLTATTFRALWYYRNTYVGVAAALTKAQNFLLSQRDGARSWGENFNTALALIALTPHVVDLSLIDSSVAALSGEQRADGSWNDDAQTTALALQALWLATHRPPGVGFAVIQGTAIDAITRLPLAGVSITLGGPISRSQITASDGVFRFQDLPVGTYTLVFVLNGYSSITTTTTAPSTRMLDLGALALTKAANATTGTARGTIKDGVTNLPLAGVSVSITGVVSLALTDGAGDYQIANVPQGQVTLTASKNGYTQAGGSGNLAAGGVLIFSAALYPVASPTTAIQGQVTAAADGQPLPGVTIRMNGIIRATTDTLGNYRIENVTPGTLTLNAERSGYDTVTAVAEVAINTLTVFSPRLYATNTTPPGGNTAGVQGVVIDAGTNAPLAGVFILLTFDGSPRSLITTADGRFSFTGLAATGGTLAFSLNGYAASNLSVTLSPLTILDVGQVRLRKADVSVLLPDLIVQSVNAQQVTNDPQTFALSGSLSVTIANDGSAAAALAPRVLTFHDVNRNNVYEPGVDLLFGEAQATQALAVNATEQLAIPLTGTLPFRDAPISAWVDSAQTVAESNENNNVSSTASACNARPSVGAFDPVLKWAWTGSSVLPTYDQVFGPLVVAPIEDTNGDGLINQLDVPAIMFSSYPGDNIIGDGVLRAISGKDGHDLWTVTNPAFRTDNLGAIAVGDIDNDGSIDIVATTANGNAAGASANIIAFERTGVPKWKSSVTLPFALSAIAIADLNSDGFPKIIVGNTVFNSDGSLLWHGTGFKGTSDDRNFFAISIVADIDLDGKPEVIAGASAYSSDGRLLWQNDVAGDGYAAVGNFNQDPYPEIVVVSRGRVSLLNHLGEIIWGPVQLPGGEGAEAGRNIGGAPTIADLDGDGIPEIGIAMLHNYVVLKVDGSILWTSAPTEDGSGVTGSSVFDFDGDGRAEVVYSDERNLYVFRGADGALLLRIPNTNGTAIELPIVADVDGDGHADIAVAANAFFQIRGIRPGPSQNGIRVFQDRNNSWINTRKIWNQHTYHITNINDDGTIPRVEQNSWQVSNTYRLNAFPDRRGSGIPDLTAGQVRFSAGISGASLTARIGNGGAETSPSDVIVRFYEGNPAAGGRVIGEVVLGSLLPGTFTDVTLSNITSLAGNIDLYIVVDAANRVTECREDNNIVSIPGPALFPDLVISATDATQASTNPQTLAVTGALSVTVRNQGTLGVGPGVQLLAFYDVNGDSAYQSGTDVVLGTATISVGLAVGVSQTIALSINGSASFRDAPIKVWIDSAQTVLESNELNNVAVALPAGMCQANPAAPAEVFGLKSCGSDPHCIGSNSNSLPPTRLFSFRTDGSSFRDIGAVTLQGNNIDADALALSDTHGLLAFELKKSGGTTLSSTLISIDRNTAQATVVGQALNGRDIRGAVSDQFDKLWVLDAASNEVLRIDPVTGAVVDTPAGLSLNAVPFDLRDSSDIAVNADGIFYVADLENIFTLNIFSGALTLVHTDKNIELGAGGSGPALAGIAFSKNAPRDTLFGYDINGFEDIHRYGIEANFARTTLHADILPRGLFFNAGRGDLASALSTELPDLTASLLNIVDRGIGKGGSLSLRVGNAGAASAPAALVSFYDGNPAAGGTLLGSLTVASLAAGAYQDVQLNGVAAISGVRDLYAVVDADNKISECNELNNTTTLAAPQSKLGRIAVSTDAPIYGPNGPVMLNAVATNTGAFSGAFSVELRVEDTNGVALAIFPPRAVGPLAGGASLSLTENWNSASYIAGTYRLHGWLRSPEGMLLHETASPFAIQHSTTDTLSVTLRTTADRPIYHTNDLVDIQNLVSNVTTNALIDGASLRVTITDPLGVVVFTNTNPLGQLVPSALRDLHLPYTLRGASVQTYTVKGEVIGADQSLLAQSTATFEVRLDLAKSLLGTAQAALPTLEAGATQTCTSTLTNVGDLSVAALEAHYTLINIDTQALNGEQVTTVDLAPGGSNTFVRSLNTNALSAGNYACAVQVRIGTELKMLAFAPFVVKVPPIKIDTTLKAGMQGRVLILLDPARQCGTNCTDDRDRDPHGPKDAPGLAAQRAFLEKLLKDAGWSYTITDTADAFTREFHTGGYSVYALLAEDEKLSEQTQKELREAVFRGEGLVVAGAHDNRNLHRKRLNDALGLKVSGHLRHAQTVVLSATDLGLTGEISLIPGDKALRIKRLTGVSAGVYPSGTRIASDDADDCRKTDNEAHDKRLDKSSHDNKSEDQDDDDNEHEEHEKCEANLAGDLDAVTLNAYGHGQSAFAGFDLLAQATRDGDTSLAAQLLIKLVSKVHPANLATGPGAVIPVALTLKNQGIAVTIAATVTLPPGVSVIDAGTGQASGQLLTWTFPLAVDEQKTVTAWIRLPDQSGPVTLNATVTASTGSTSLTASPTLTLSVTPPEELGGIKATLEALLQADHPDKKALAKAISRLDKAIKYIDSRKAIVEALKATDALLGLTDPLTTNLRVSIDARLRWVALHAYNLSYE